MAKYYDWQLAFYLFVIFFLYPIAMSWDKAGPDSELWFSLGFHFVMWVPLAIFVNYGRHRAMKRDLDLHDSLWPLRKFEEVRAMNAYHCKMMFDIMKPLRISFMTISFVVLTPIVAMFAFMPVLTAKVMILFFAGEHLYDIFSQYVNCVNDMGEGGKKEKAKEKAKMTDLQLSRWKQLIQGMGCG